MTRFSLTAAILIMMTAISAAVAAGGATANASAFPGTLANARYVYVASYDGDQLIRTSSLKIGKRSASCKAPFRIGAN